MSKNRIKGNKYDRVSYSIPFYTDSYFKPEDEEDENETKEVKIPLKINPREEGNSKLNTTYLIVRAIEHLGRQYRAGIGQFRPHRRQDYAVKNQWQGQGG